MGGWSSSTPARSKLERLSVEDVNIYDIMHGLGAINRFIGQTRIPLSVLWHSMMVTQLCRETPPEVQLEALFHDAAETYVGDWIRPLSAVIGTELRNLRDQVQLTCHAAAGITKPHANKSPAVQEADELMQRYELQSSWGFNRQVAWQRPVSAAETARVERALETIGKPPEQKDEKQSTGRAFLRMAKSLLPPDAPIRTTLSRGPDRPGRSRTRTV